MLCVRKTGQYKDMHILGEYIAVVPLGVTTVIIYCYSTIASDKNSHA